jgi:hypothetical protein
MKIQTELKQRPGDNRWALWGLIPDPNENINEWQARDLPVPQKWVQLKIFDYLIEKFEQ